MGITAPEAMLGGSVLSGIMGMGAAGNAASTQAAAANQASQNQLTATNNSNALQYQMLQQSLQNSSPYMQGGQQAYSALMGAMGLGAPTAGQSGGQSSGQSGGNGSYTNAAGQTVNAAGGTTNPNSMFPTSNYGATQGQLNSANGLYSGALTQQFTPSSLNLSPAYQFQLSQGEQALQASGAATGMLQTGQGLKNINDYAQNSASTAYQNAFNNFQTNQNNLYNRLSGLVTPGANATAGANSAMQSTGANIAQNTMSGVSASNNYLTSGAAANAAGQMGTANALSGAATGGVNSWMGNQIMTNYLNGNNGVSPATPYNTVNMSGFQSPTQPLNYNNYGSTPNTGSITGDY